MGLECEPCGLMLQLTGEMRSQIVNGPSQDVSKHLLMPGACLKTMSPGLNEAANSDSFVSLLDDCLDYSDFLI